MALLVSFVRSGSPNTYKLDHTPTWPKYSRMERSRMVLQARRAEASHTNIGKTLGLLTGSCDVEILSSDEKARFDFWFAKVDKTQN
ncbi:hypothetical protein FRB94_011802 [Tulasnella sp. JGI-2019a]|nr:hypothetical protein FRB93_002251 [Tulasnella sp. JGI-2019a]KAG9014624.1 hypothetical protein FRB94_011802 [Tulasnella sp. JGI-2019a]